MDEEEAMPRHLSQVVAELRRERNAKSDEARLELEKARRLIVNTSEFIDDVAVSQHINGEGHLSLILDGREAFVCVANDGAQSYVAVNGDRVDDVQQAVEKIAAILYPA